MKCVLVFVLALIAIVCSEEYYSSDRDSLDIHTVINNPEQRNAFVNCFIDVDDCTPALAEFKKDLPEAIQQSCAKCTPAQKAILRDFLEGLKKYQPEGYTAIKNKFDPENKYFGPLEAAIA